MPVGKESIKRAAGTEAGKKRASSRAASAVKAEAVIAAPAEEVVEKIVAPAAEDKFAPVHVGETLPVYLL